MMEDFGKGMLMTGREQEEIDQLNEQLGMRELRAKINGKAGITDKQPPNRLSIQAESNYGTHSVEIVRKFLDSGVLSKFLDDEFGGDRCWNGADAHRYTTLITCAMTLGCALSPEILDSEGGLSKMVHPAYLAEVKKKYPKYCRPLLAIQQLRKAVKEYEPGKPYDFGNKTFLEVFQGKMLPGQTSYTDLGFMKLIEVKQKGGGVLPQIIGAPSDAEIGLEDSPIYPAHVCANCGDSNGEGLKDLMVCARCHDRKYCGRVCQKKHWKLHKPICTIPTEQMEKFMESVTLDTRLDVKAAHETVGKALGDSSVVVMSGKDNLDLGLDKKKGL